MATLATPSPLLHLWAGRVDPKKVRLKGQRPSPESWGPHARQRSHVLGGQVLPLHDADGQRAALGHRGSTTRGPGPGEPDARIGCSGPAGGLGTGRRGGRAAPGAGGKRGGGGIASTSFTPRPRPTCGGHCARAGQSAAGAPRGGRGWPGSRRSLAAWGEGRGLRQVLLPCWLAAGWRSRRGEGATVGARVACATGTCGRRAWSQCQSPGARGLWALVCAQRRGQARGQARGHAGRGRAQRTILAPPSPPRA